MGRRMGSIAPYKGGLGCGLSPQNHRRGLLQRYAVTGNRSHLTPLVLIHAKWASM